ncbi:MAG: hypothetical protein ACJASY_004455 [Halioglobus sp.]
MSMDIELPISILQQPDDTTCGPTCLQAVYNYYGDKTTLDEVIESAHAFSQGGGTLAVFLACDALRRGYQATIYTYNLQVFDPSWFASQDIDIAGRLARQAEVKQDNKLQHATHGYIEFLKLGGKLLYVDLTAHLLRGIIRQRLPVLTGLSSTYLYNERRVYGEFDTPDDIRGFPGGHFVIISGYHRDKRTVLINDPFEPNPLSDSLTYAINIDRVICSVLLGVLTQDANLLVIQPSPERKHP